MIGVAFFAQNKGQADGGGGGSEELLLYRDLSNMAGIPIFVYLKHDSLYTLFLGDC